jgi:diaminohydroxyphosphoribosylaminopyrimidine deaminase/5-amino-6-(5-phosphoribosylamino)uracil reductase
VEVICLPQAPTGHLSLPAVLATLAERKILSLLLECGPRLNAAFLAEDLVDKVILFYGPSTLGESALPFAEGIAPPQLLHQTQTTFGPDTCITGYLHNPWPEANTRSPEDTAPSG